MYVVVVEDYSEAADSWDLKAVLGPFEDWGTAYDKETDINQGDNYFAQVVRVQKEL